MPWSEGDPLQVRGGQSELIGGSTDTSGVRISSITLLSLPLKETSPLKYVPLG